MQNIQEENLFSHRENFKAMMTSHIETFDSGVYCISAKWGMGKTFLIHKIIENFPKNKKPLYFDAWKYDKYKNPLVALYMGIVIGEDEALINNFKSSSKVKFTEIYTEIVTKGEIGFNVPLLAASTKESKIQTEKEKSTVAHSIENAFDINKCYSDLSKLFKEENAVLIIDELDRANPHFTISFLEVIKHFFQEVSIYLVTDRVVLSEVVNNYYGFNSGYDYLEKIIDDTFLLPEIPETLGEKREIIKKFTDENPDTIAFSIIEESLNNLSIRQLQRLEKKEIPNYKDYVVFFGEITKQRFAYILDMLFRIEKVCDFSNYYNIISDVQAGRLDMKNNFIEKFKHIIKNKLSLLLSDEEIEEDIKNILKIIIEAEH